jgi:alkaline phosphatase D
MRTFFLSLIIFLIYTPSSLGQDLNSPDRLETLAFGSCNRTDLDPKIWATIAKKNPELWVWLGDIVYTDDQSMEDLAKKYAIQKKQADYQKLASNATILGVWDDHDFGDNDAGRSFSKKEESRKLLFDFLEIPADHPAQKRTGAYQSYCYGIGNEKLCIYLLDVRYFKEDYEPDPSSNQRYKKNNGSLLGEAQWNWLEKELEQNNGQVNIFAGGIQLISSEHPYEKWANFPLAQTRFFDLLDQHRVKNPLYLSGDRHIAEVSAVSLDSGVCLYDITSSGLTHSYDSLEDEANLNRISPLMTMLNFGLLSLDWEQKKLQIEILDVDGKVRYSQNILIE